MRDRLWLAIALVVVLAVGGAVTVAVRGGDGRAAAPGPERSPSASARPSPSRPPPSPSRSPAPSPPAEGRPESYDPPSQAELVACVAGEGGVMERLGSAPVEADDAPEQVEVITQRVEGLRGLTEREEIDAEFLDSAAIEARTSEAVAAEYGAEEADLDGRLLAALGAAPPDLDLRAVQSELISGQIAGFYDTDGDDLVVRADDPGRPLPPAEQVTLAHEVEHALADQAFGLDLPEGATGDAQAASTALIEGDATLTMQRFSLEAFDLAEQQEMAASPDLAASSAQLEDFPHVLTASLLFSYSEGLAFVCDRYAEGGWAAVDAAYAQRPTTTAEILFPERYPRAAVEPRPLPGPGGTWTQADTDTLGAADLLFLFEAPGDDREAALDQPRARVADWAGGTYALHTDGDATALAVALVGGAGRGPGLCDSVAQWYDAAFPDAAEVPAEGAALARDGAEQDAVLRCGGDEVRLGIAPDLATARTLAG